MTDVKSRRGNGSGRGRGRQISKKVLFGCEMERARRGVRVCAEGLVYEERLRGVASGTRPYFPGNQGRIRFGRSQSIIIPDNAL